MHIQVTQILSLNTHGATCTLLKLNNSIKLLINCGLPLDFSLTHYDAYQNELNDISLVVITSPSVSHSGAFPFLSFKNTAKILTTTPIYYLYSINIYNELQHAFEFDQFSSYINIFQNKEKIEMIKYNQTFFYENLELCFKPMGKCLGSFGLFWDYQGETGLYLDEVSIYEELCVQGGWQENMDTTFVIWAGYISSNSFQIIQQTHQIPNFYNQNSNFQNTKQVEQLNTDFLQEVKKGVQKGGVVIGVEEDDRVLEVLLQLSRAIERWKTEGENVALLYFNNFKFFIYLEITLIQQKVSQNLCQINQQIFLIKVIIILLILIQNTSMQLF